MIVAVSRLRLRLRAVRLPDLMVGAPDPTTLSTCTGHLAARTVTPSEETTPPTTGSPALRGAMAR